MKYLLYKDEREEDWFIPRTGERYEFYVKSPISWKNICDVRTVYRMVKKIRNYGRHNIPLKIDEADWQLICEKYPWFERYDNEVQHKLGTLLLRLFALSIREDMADVEKEIFTQNHLDEDGLRALTVGESADELVIGKNNLWLQKSHLYANVRWKPSGRYGGSEYCIYHEGEEFFMEGARRHYLSEKAQERMNDMIREVRVLKGKALAKEEDFHILEMADIHLAFRPFPKDIPIKELDSAWISSRNRKYYQFLIISREEDSIKQRFCEWKDLISDYDGSGFDRHDWHEAEKREDVFLRDYAPAIMQLAEEAGDRYLLYTMKSFLHEQTEDECEYLARMDGEPHYVAWQEEKTVQSIEIHESQCGPFSFFNRRPRYFCRVLLEGKEYDTIWWPESPRTIHVTEYHHTVNVHLTEEQVRYFWETTNANPDSKPFIGMPKKIAKE